MGVAQPVTPLVEVARLFVPERPCAASSTASFWMSAMTTLAPASASAVAIARPMLEAAPVTIAVCRRCLSSQGALLELETFSRPQRGRCAGSCRRRRPLADGPRSPLSRRRACSRDRKRASRFERSEGSEENADVLGQEHLLVEDDLAVGDLPRAGNAPQ